MKIGDKVQRRPETFGGLEGKSFGATGRRRALTGEVVYIHPEGWYHMVEFTVRGGKVRECFLGRS